MGKDKFKEEAISLLEQGNWFNSITLLKANGYNYADIKKLWYEINYYPSYKETELASGNGEIK